MPAVINLSKNFTLKSVIGFLRLFVNEVTKKRITNLMLIDIIHLAVINVVQQLGLAAAKDYVGEPVTVTQTNDVIDISTYNVDQIFKIIDSISGLVLPEDHERIESLDDPQSQANIYFVRLGERVYLKKGSDIPAYGTLKMFFSRAPIKVTALIDTLDIKDIFMPLVMDSGKVKVFEMLNMAPPEQLTGSIANAIQQIKNATAQEMDNATKIKG